MWWLRRQCGMRQEPERPETIVDTDEHYTLLRKWCAVKNLRTSPTTCMTTAMKPHHHWPRFSLRLSSCPHIQVETILVSVKIASCVHRTVWRRLLPASRTKFSGSPCTLPRFHGCRRLPATFTNRSFSIRDAPKHAHTAAIFNPLTLK